jgi:hypothetical protein
MEFKTKKLLTTICFFIPMFICSIILSSVDVNKITSSPNIKGAKDASIVFITFFCLFIILSAVDFSKKLDKYDDILGYIKVVLFLILFGSYFGVMILLYKDASTIDNESDNKNKDLLKAAMGFNGLSTAFILIVFIAFLYYKFAKPFDYKYAPVNWFDFVPF